MQTLENYLHHLWDVSLEAAPWLLIGLLAAGLIKAWVPTNLIGRWLGGRGIGPVVKAALVGAPLPLCSCGVLPAAVSLRRQGASRGATVSFLVSTPETGVDSIALSYALLGPFMAIIRPIASVLSAVFTGLLVESLPEEKPRSSLTVVSEETCCETKSCCDKEAKPAEKAFLHRSIDGLKYAMTDLVDDLSLWIVIGLMLAAGVVAFLPPLSLAQWGSGLPAMGIMLLVGIPMYICASASTPLAAAMLIAGISPGTVLVFLLAGPATNVATIVVVRREMGLKVTVAYLVGIAIGAVAAGMITDWAVHHFAINIPAQLSEASEIIPVWLAILAAVALIIAGIRRPFHAIVSRMGRKSDLPQLIEHS